MGPGPWALSGRGRGRGRHWAGAVRGAETSHAVRGGLWLGIREWRAGAGAGDTPGLRLGLGWELGEVKGGAWSGGRAEAGGEEAGVPGDPGEGRAAVWGRPLLLLPSVTVAAFGRCQTRAL